MSNAPLDENGAQGIICASKNDGRTVVPILARPATRGLFTANGTGQVDNGNNGGNSLIDENGKFAWVAFSSLGDGSRVEVYADPISKAILIQNN